MGLQGAGSDQNGVGVDDEEDEDVDQLRRSKLTACLIHEVQISSKGKFHRRKTQRVFSLTVDIQRYGSIDDGPDLEGKPKKLGGCCEKDQQETG